MERLEYRFSGGTPVAARNAPVLAGVLGSGNLEVLIEPADLGGAVEVAVDTAARGFDEIWQAVLADVFARWAVGDLRVTINDAGATPAVVALRLDQALGDYTGGTL